MKKYLWILYGFFFLLVLACQPTSTASKLEQFSEKKDSILAAIIQDSLPIPSIVPTQTPRTPDYDTTKWTDISFLDTSILLDLKYATTDNFVQTKMYDCPRCFLRPEVANAIVAAHKKLQKQGYGLKMFDCYRPRPIQYKLWEKVPDPRFVANPDKGSMHNRGTAVDLTIVDNSGKELDMGTPFDFFGKEGYHTYMDHSNEVLANRQLLKVTMAEFGLKHIRTEWWHYSYTKKKYPLSDMLWKCPKAK